MSTDDKTIQEEHPKLFISYSWSSPEHIKRVLNLATYLRESGVDVIFDKWDLKEGADSIAFMESMVTNPDIKKVIIVCDKQYAEKTDGRNGGVGTEAQIISHEIYDKQNQDKFVAVIFEKNENGEPYLPTYCKSRIYIDMSDSELYNNNVEQVFRWIFNKPLYPKPNLGRIPAFLEETESISLGTSYLYKQAMDALHNGQSNAKGVLQEFFDAFVENIEKFRIKPIEDREYDDLVVENIKQFLPYRDELIRIFLSIARYSNKKETEKQLHQFFEKLFLYQEDNFKFIIHEIFLYCIAVLLKEEAFNTVSFLLKSRYYVNNNGKTNMQGYQTFVPYLSSLQNRNQRLNLERVSVHADILKERSNNSIVNFEQLKQADFILYIRSCVDSIKKRTLTIWEPKTLIYRYDIFEIFSRAESQDYFESIKIVLGIEKKEEFEDIFNALKNNHLPRPCNSSAKDLYEIVNYEKLGTLP